VLLLLLVILATVLLLLLAAVLVLLLVLLSYSTTVLAGAPVLLVPISYWALLCYWCYCAPGANVLPSTATVQRMLLCYYAILLLMLLCYLTVLALVWPLKVLLCMHISSDKQTNPTPVFGRYSQSLHLT
jgi:hypothetical protein